MKRTFLYPVVLAVAASMALPFAQLSSAAAGETNVRHTIIAASGDAAPGGGNYLSLRNATVNAQHQVAFDAVVSGPTFGSGVFVGDGTTTSTVMLGAASRPFITPNGEVVFTVSDIDSFSSDGKTIVPLVRDGDPVPGGGTLTPLARDVNDHGVLAYGAFISGSTATQGIFRSDGTQTVTIANDTIPPPTGGTFTLLGDPVINERGQVAFFSGMEGGSSDFGIFRGEGAELTPVFVANQIAPGGATFSDFGDPVINSHGQVATVALLTNSTSRTGVFIGDGTNSVAIALEGQTAPKGGTYADPLHRGAFGAPVRLSDRGEVAFNAILTGGTSSSGIFRGDGEHTTTIALAGTVAPGTTGRFNSFGDIKLLNNGRVAFIASLTPGVGGVNTSNNLGIWIGTSDDDLQLVARTGDVIGGKVLTRLPQFDFFFGGAHSFDLNENGVLWVGTFGPAKAVVFSRILGDDESSDVE
jgi:hypothetical protein